jgi:meiotically up-regulated gene 157 (Mug157) protein
MISRRQFIRGAFACAAGAWAFRPGPLFAFASARPPAGERKFASPAIEELIGRVKNRIGDPELAWMFENCLPNTLDTTIHAGTEAGRPDTFVITGDIEAMWLRDSAAQVWPYLRLTGKDKKLRAMLSGVINRQARCILLDPYANAFLLDSSKKSEWQGDLTEMKPGVHERKWEVDSPAYVMRLSHGYWKATGDLSPFDITWREAMSLIARTYREQQRMAGPGPYRFRRRTDNPIDTMWRGLGYPAKPCGLIHTAFRPSDDSGFYPFLVPSNAFAATTLQGLAVLFRDGLKDISGAGDFYSLAGEIERGMELYARAGHPVWGSIYAYEVDGFGNALMTDDPNVPGLLSLPYLGCCAEDDALYLRTRAFIHSRENPWFFRGKVAEGLGSPHTGPRRIWPLSLIMRAMTSRDDGEIRRCLAMLKASHGGTGLMHESFDVDDPSKYSRPWFGWANSLFGELILMLAETRPHLLA